MVQILEPKESPFGRIGKGIGQGLSEQIPKEMEHKRLRTGLQELADLADKGNLSPAQFLARAAGTYGATPQIVQSFGDLARQQAKARSLNLSLEEKPTVFPEMKEKIGDQTNYPSITKEKPLEKIQEGYIPPTQEEIYNQAKEMFNKNPALFENNPQKAIEAAENAAIRKEKINEAYLKQHENLQKIQDNIVERLQKQSEKLGVNIPSNLYSSIEDRAIQAVKPKSEGGRGLTEQQAMKEFGNELDMVSRDYSTLNSLGGWGITTNKPSETLRSLQSLQKKAEQRGDTENMADAMVSNNDVSPKFAYSIMEPVAREPKLNEEIKKLPNLKETINVAALPYISKQKTKEIAPILANLLGEKGSPLAVAYELEKKGYDAAEWLDSLLDANLKENQRRQVDKKNNLVGKFNDWWLSSWSGIK